MKTRRTLWGRSLVAVGIAVCGLLAMAAPAAAQPQGMDLSQASGVPLPATDLPAGSVSVRVVRGSFANNLSGVDVTFTVDGTDRTVTTDASGRAQVAGLAPGSRLQASVTVDGEQISSQPITIGSSGIRFVLVAGVGAGSGGSAPAATPPVSSPPSVPAVSGQVTFGADSRIVADYSEERLNIFYVLQIVNPASTPVDLGGPLVVDLPTGARGAQVLQDSTAKATANGPRIVMTGPFAPGTSSVSLAYELPFSGGTAHLEQTWPVSMAQLTFFLLQNGGFDLSSAQFTTKQNDVQQGQALVVGLVPTLQPGQSLSVDISGLPHRPVWPRNTALALGGALTLLGIWGAVSPGLRRRSA